MESTTPNLAPLSEYVSRKDLTESIKHTLPTEESVRWFVRRNFDALIDAGALIEVSKRQRFHVQRFEQVVLAIGHAAAKGRR